MTESLVQAVLRKRAEPLMYSGPVPPMPPPEMTLAQATWDFQQGFIRSALKRNAGNQKAAAKDLGLGYSTLKALLRRMRMSE